MRFRGQRAEDLDGGRSAQAVVAIARWLHPAAFGRPSPLCTGWLG
jgi:hypothetical protein